VERPRTYTQEMRQSQKGSSARIESKGARVPRRGDRPLQRAQGDASEIHGEETPLTSGSHPPVARQKLMHARGWRPGPTRQQSEPARVTDPKGPPVGTMVAA
jgi:hypothetical protein